MLQLAFRPPWVEGHRLVPSLIAVEVLKGEIEMPAVHVETGKPPGAFLWGRLIWAARVPCDSTRRV
jgi:hypothetical protein